MENSLHNIMLNLSSRCWIMIVVIIIEITFIIAGI